MIILSASMPLMNGDSFGTLDHHVVKFSAILYLVQIMAGLTQTDPKPDSEDTDVLRPRTKKSVNLFNIWDYFQPHLNFSAKMNCIFTNIGISVCLIWLKWQFCLFETVEKQSFSF